jgi:tetratricopeptide (TPR) repeat protein
MQQEKPQLSASLEEWTRRREAAALQRKQQDAPPRPSQQPGPDDRAAAAAAPAPATVGGTSTALRERGNEAFKSGDFVLAKELYSTSLALEETAEALCNRALACIKLGEYSLAIADCSRAAQLNPRHIKAYARRGQARSLSGAHDLALEDFAQACGMDPSNKALRKEMEREQAILAAHKAAAVPPVAPAVAAMVVELDGNSRSGSSRPPVVSRPKLQQPPLATAAPANVVDGALRIADLGIRVPDTAPANLYAFEKVWRDLKGRKELRTSLLLSTMRDADYVRCFSKSLEPDLFLDMIAHLPVPCTPGSVGAMCALTSLPSFDLTRMFMTRANKAAIAAALPADVHSWSFGSSEQKRWALGMREFADCV